MDDLLVLILMGLLGLIFIYLGYLIWIKEKINIIHSYHYTKVSETDKKAYTGIMGKAVILMGIGMILSGVICILTHTENCMIAFGVCFIGGLGMMTYAQLKYNRGII